MRGNLFAVAVDLVVLTVRDAELCALLVRRDSPPFAGRWGLPGGQIERGESPQDAVSRELEEELSLYLPSLLEVGPYPYKRSLHMVYAAEVTEPIRDWDDTELLDIGWFSVDDVRELRTKNRLHADYELHAIEALLQKLG